MDAADPSSSGSRELVHSEGISRLTRKNLRARPTSASASSTQEILEFHYSDEHRSVTDRSLGKVRVQNYMNNLCRPECRILLFRAFRPYRLWANSSTSARARHFLTGPPLAISFRSFPLAHESTKLSRITLVHTCVYTQGERVWFAIPKVPLYLPHPQPCNLTIVCIDRLIREKNSRSKDAMFLSS